MFIISTVVSHTCCSRLCWHNLLQTC